MKGPQKCPACGTRKIGVLLNRGPATLACKEPSCRVLEFMPEKEDKHT